jgi:hypothetical protein
MLSLPMAKGPRGGGSVWLFAALLDLVACTDQSTSAIDAAAPDASQDAADQRDAGGDVANDQADTSEPPLEILAAQVPDSQCNPAAERDARTRATSGILDVALDKPYPYLLYPLLGNRLAHTVPTTTPDPNAITLTEMEVNLVPPDGVRVSWPANCPGEFREPAAGVIGPDGFQALTMPAMRPCHGATLRGVFEAGELDRSLGTRVTFMAEIRAHGIGSAGAVASTWFEFPIRVCYGCLQTGFVGALAEYSFGLSPPKVLRCDQIRENPYPGNPCNPAQDVGPLLCCSVDGNAAHLVCPAKPSAPP